MILLKLRLVLLYLGGALASGVLGLFFGLLGLVGLVIGDYLSGAVFLGASALHIYIAYVCFRKFLRIVRALRELLF